MDLVKALRKFVREHVPRESATRVELIHLCQDLLRVCGEYSGNEPEEVVRHVHWCRVLAATGFECQRDALLDSCGRIRFAEPSARQMLAEARLRDLFVEQSVFSPEACSFVLVLLAECAVGARAFSVRGERELAYFQRFDLDEAGYEMRQLGYDLEVYENILAHAEAIVGPREHVSKTAREARMHVSGFWAVHGPMLPRMHCAAFMDAPRLCEEITEVLHAWELLRSDLRSLLQQFKASVLELVESAIHTLPATLLGMFVAMNVGATHATDAEDSVLARENDRDVLVGRLTVSYMEAVAKLQDFMASTIHVAHAQSWSVLAIFFLAHCFQVTDDLGMVTRYDGCALEFVAAVDEATQMIGPITEPSTEIRLITREELAARAWLRSPEVYLETKRMLRRVLAHLFVALIVSVEHGGVEDTCKMMNVFLAEGVRAHPQIVRCKARLRERKAVESVLQREHLDKQAEDEIAKAVMEAMNRPDETKKTIRDMSPDELCRQLGALELTVVT
jgi:hypothetical protein